MDLDEMMTRLAVCRVYADRLEVRLCRACWKEWDARVKGRSA